MVLAEKRARDERRARIKSGG